LKVHVTGFAGTLDGGSSMERKEGQRLLEKSFEISVVVGTAGSLPLKQCELCHIMRKVTKIGTFKYN
jgi:hypothetical protein